jgi:hypothetical protein
MSKTAKQIGLLLLFMLCVPTRSRNMQADCVPNFFDRWRSRLKRGLTGSAIKAGEDKLSMKSKLARAPVQ